MNRKIIAGGLAMTLCLIAVAPVYKNFSFKKEIPEPATMQADAQTTKGLELSYEALRSENLGSKNDLFTTTFIPAKNVKAISNTVASPKSTPALKKTARPVKKPTATTIKKTTTTTNKPSIRTTSTSRGTTSTVSTNSTTIGSKASAVVATAKKYIGVPYVWGGETPSGFDCSGFTQYVFGKNGITLPRTSADQYKVGVSVSKSNLRVGDLVFFTTYKAGPSHLGIYIGNNQFIHSSSSKGVTITSMSNSYFEPRYIGARRVI